MTILNLPTVRYDGKREGGYVICKQGTKEIHAWTGNDNLLEEEAKPQNKEQAREKAKVDAYNPSMEEGLKGVFGGGDHAEVRIPLWQFLDHKEKKTIRFAVKLYQRGDLAELKARWNDVNLNRIINKIIDNALHTQHESRTTRKGLRYSTFGNERSNKPGFAGTMETRCSS